MMLVLSRVLVFVLLIVDWAEDPHFGRYVFSAPLASSAVSTLDVGFRQSKCLEQSARNDPADLPIAELGLRPTVDLSLSVDEPLAIDPSPRTLYVFMSLQR